MCLKRTVFKKNRLPKAACHPHKSENLVHAYWRYHLVERCTMSIKKDRLLMHTKLQNPTLGGLSIDTYKLSATPKYDRKHSSAVPPIPNRWERREIKIQWSTVSNAAERSRSSTITDLFWSKAIRYHYGHGLEPIKCCEASCALIDIWHWDQWHLNNQ